MKKNLMRLGAVLSLGVFLTPLTSFAAIDRAVMNVGPDGNLNGTMSWIADFFDGTTYQFSTGDYFDVSTTTTSLDYITKAQAAAGQWAAGQGYTINTFVWPYARIQDVNSAVAAATSSLATVARTGSYNDLTNKPTIPTVTSMSFATSSRSLNSAFQVSSTRASYVNYSVDIATTVSLSGGQVGTVYLEYADDSGFTTNVTEIGRFVNGQTGTLVVGLTLNQTNTAQVQGMIPAGKYVRLRTQNNTGTPTFTYRSGQEVLLASN
jgi:hypothetical protein